MSALDPGEVARALSLDPQWAARLRQQWLELMGLALFGDLRSQRLGTLPRLRKKVLDCGEKGRAALADRDWIPQPRERLKNALASALEQSLADLDSAARELEGGADLEAYRAAVAALSSTAREGPRSRRDAWAALLDGRS